MYYFCSRRSRNSRAVIAARDELAIAVLTTTFTVVRIPNTPRADTRAVTSIAPEEGPAVLVRLHVRAGRGLASVGGAGPVRCATSVSQFSLAVAGKQSFADVLTRGCRRESGQS